MKIVSILWVFLLVLPLACQRSAGVGDDSESEDTDTVTETIDTATISDSASSEPGSDRDTDTDTSTVDSDTLTDTGSDTEPLPDPVENEWIFIEGGSFDMGSELYEYSQPVHTVAVPSFEILKTEVTVHQYGQCVDAGECSVPHDFSEDSTNYCDPSWYRNNWYEPYKLNFPVNCIDYFQAGEYCAWIGGRLPSEAEWEYTARGGGQNIEYPWGDEYPTCELVAAWDGLDNYTNGDCWSFEQPVCSKPSGNSFHGLCDMSGNYEEWVADRVRVQFGYEFAPTDGTAWNMDDYGNAGVRGGYYYNAGSSLSVYIRNSENIYSDSAESITVRCVRNL